MESREEGHFLFAQSLNTKTYKTYKDIQRKERDDGMAAFIGEFLYELIKLIILAGVSVAAIFCGKKLRDRKDAKTASEQKSN